MTFKSAFTAILSLTLAASLTAACAPAPKDKKELTASEVAKYQEALDSSAHAVPMGTELTVSVSGDAPSALPDNVPANPARDIVVPAADYDAFFDASPAVILARVSLEPIRDGNTLLGYKIVKFNDKAFDGVDLREDDIIVAIDHKLPNTPDDYFDAWQKLKASNKASIDVQRSVSKFSITWTKAE